MPSVHTACRTGGVVARIGGLAVVDLGIEKMLKKICLIIMLFYLLIYLLLRFPMGFDLSFMYFHLPYREDFMLARLSRCSRCSLWMFSNNCSRNPQQEPTSRPCRFQSSGQIWAAATEDMRRKDSYLKHTSLSVFSWQH